ncbi:MAG: hypothetical protein Q8L71_06955 [Thiobacillus sp.]|nr:hypothetical protein [Thiobacillus sp.]
MEQEINGAAVDRTKPQPKSRLVSIVSILREVAELSDGELTVAELADALGSGAYDALRMMLYPGGGSGLAEPLNSQYRPDKATGFSWRAETVRELYKSHFWDNPGATMLTYPHGHIDAENLLVLKDDGIEIARRLWKFFYPTQELTIDLSRIAEGTSTRRSEGKPGYSTPHLVVLKDAIAEFFEPRRDKDAKKEEVVEWIKSKMTASGMADSENIAQAIFTIIKPLDHDPRKRRG